MHGRGQWKERGNPELNNQSPLQGNIVFLL